MTKFTFKLNGVDFSGLVHKNGYQTDLKPVVSWSMTDLSGVEHQVISRWRYELTLELNPMTAAQAQALCAELRYQPISATFTSLQTGEDVSAEMRVEEMPLQHQLTARNTDWHRGFTLTLQQL